MDNNNRRTALIVDGRQGHVNLNRRAEVLPLLRLNGLVGPADPSDVIAVIRLMGAGFKLPKTLLDRHGLRDVSDEQ